VDNTTDTQFDGSIEQAVGLITRSEEEPETVEQEEITESEDVSPELEASESEEVDDTDIDDGEEDEEVEVEMSDDDEEADDEADQEAPVLYTVKVDGKEEQVTLEDLQRGYSGQKYVQKGMQEAAAQKKQAEEVYSALLAERQQLVDMYQQMQQGQFLTKPNPPSEDLLSSDPLGYIEQKARYDRAVEDYNQQQGKMAQIMQQSEQARERAVQAYLQQEMQSLANVMPEFSDAQKATKLKDKLVDGGQNYYGYTKDDIDGIMDHRAIRVLNDAIKYREIVAGKSKAEKKAKGAKPVIKPGAKKIQNPSRKAMERQKAKFKQSGRIEDLVGLIVNE
jgi:hypothetical protein